MIEIRGLEKTFQDIKAIDNITATIKDGFIFGLVGSNGAGKSTLLRLMSGVLKAENGTVEIDGQSVYECVSIKKEICFLPDTAYFLPNATPKTMSRYYAQMYPKFDVAKFENLTGKFGMDLERKIDRLSKGTKKQVSILLGICANTKYLFCDETFDGLDPVMRQGVKSLFASELLERDFTPVIASHNLRELEDICDYVGLLHKGGILFVQDLEDVKFHVNKIQCVIPDPAQEHKLLSELEVLQYEKSGSLLTITARGTKEALLKCAETKKPLFVEVLPLSLEEIFISETEVAGYDIKHIIS